MAEIQREQKIKAAVVFYIAKFIEWPSTTKKVKSSLRLCLLGGSNLNEAIRELFDGKIISSYPVNVLEIDSLKTAAKSNCDIVFVGAESAGLLDIDYDSIANLPILTVCEVTRPEWGHCIAQVYQAENKAKIAFDLQLSNRSGLRVSSELLAFATVRDVGDVNQVQSTDSLKISRLPSDSWR